jgi:hypothetical protein
MVSFQMSDTTETIDMCVSHARLQISPSKLARQPAWHAVTAGIWQQGVRGMKIGGQRKLIVPPNLVSCCNLNVLVAALSQCFYQPGQLCTGIQVTCAAMPAALGEAWQKVTCWMITGCTCYRADMCDCRPTVQGGLARYRPMRH